MINITILFLQKKYVRFLIPDYDVIDLAGFKSSLPEKMFVIIVMKLNEFFDNIKDMFLEGHSLSSFTEHR